MLLKTRIFLLVILLTIATAFDVWWTASSSPDRMTGLALRQLHDDESAAHGLRVWSTTSNQVVAAVGLAQFAAFVALLWPELSRGGLRVRNYFFTRPAVKET